MRNPYLVITSVIGPIAFVLAGCQLLGAEATTEVPRIRFGDSIDGIEIGTDSMAVIEKLGYPDVTGFGDFEGWTFGYVYPRADGTGYRDSLAVTIATNPEDETFGVISVTVQGLYSGRTEERIGLGSMRKVAVRAWRTPDDTQVDHVPGRRVDVYTFTVNVFEIRYTDDRITSITMRRR